MTQISIQSHTPEKSILDLNGRQIYLGNAFVSGFEAQPIGTTDETPVFLVVNPSDSKKSAFSFFRRFEILVTSNQFCTFSVYGNPLVINPGTPVTPGNLRFGLTPSVSAILTYFLPIASPFGAPSLRRSIATGSASIEDDVLCILDPGSSMLLTAKPSNTAAPIAFQLGWYEF